MIADQIAATEAGQKTAEASTGLVQSLEVGFRRVGASEAVDQQRDLDPSVDRVDQRLAHQRARAVRAEDIIEQPQTGPRRTDQLEQRLQPIRAVGQKGQRIPVDRDGAAEGRGRGAMHASSVQRSDWLRKRPFLLTIEPRAPISPAPPNGQAICGATNGARDG